MLWITPTLHIRKEFVMEFKDYTNKVIARFGLRGQNAVARELGIASSSMSNLTAGKILPSEETMIKLAELAGLPKEEALIDLNLWRSKNNPELNKIWQRLSKMVGCLSVFGVLTMATTRTNDSEINVLSSYEHNDTISQSIYYATNM